MTRVGWLVGPQSRVGCSAFVLVSLLSACAGDANDPVRDLLEELRTSAEARDAERFRSRLSDDFHGTGGIDKAEAEATLRRYFAAFESIDLQVSEVEVDRNSTTARVRCVVAFSGQVRKAFGLEGLLPPSAVYRFDLEVAGDAGSWKVRSAFWTQLEPDPQ